MNEETVRIEWEDGQPWYVGPNGWRHPFVGGGEDEQQPAQVADGAPAGTEGQAPVTEAQAQTTEPKVYDEAYVKELREEAARYRTRAKEYDDVYGAYDDNSRTALLDIARQLADPSTQPAAAKRLQAIADEILKGQEAGEPRRPDGSEDPDAKPLTRKEYEELQQARDREREEKAAIADLEREAKALGYEPNTAEYFFLLDKAQLPEVAGDLTKAHGLVEQFFADKAAQRAQQVEQSAGKWPAAAGNTGGSGAPADEAKPPTTWKEARMRAMARRTKGALGS